MTEQSADQKLKGLFFFFKYSYEQGGRVQHEPRSARAVWFWECFHVTFAHSAIKTNKLSDNFNTFKLYSQILLVLASSYLSRLTILDGWGGQVMPLSLTITGSFSGTLFRLGWSVSQDQYVLVFFFPHLRVAANWTHDHMDTRWAC